MTRKAQWKAHCRRWSDNFFGKYALSDRLLGAVVLLVFLILSSEIFITINDAGATPYPATDEYLQVQKQILRELESIHRTIEKIERECN